MYLSVKERLVLISVLPQEGDFLTIKSLREVREALSFTETEQVSLKFSNENGVLNWDEPDKDNPSRQPIEIPNSVHDLIVDAFKALDEQKKLTDDHFDLYELFVNAD